jgi:hypothetical protein
MKAFFLFPLLLVIFLSASFAQTAAPAGTAGAFSLQYQLNALKGRSSNYQENNIAYKVIRISALDSFWKSVQDTIKARESALVQARKGIDQELVQAREALKSQTAELQALKDENAQKELEVQKNAHEVATLSVLGLDINKQTYVLLSWGIIFSLLIVMCVFMFLYQNSKKVTDEKRKAFDLIDQEYKEHKQSARERELKIKRELQTEMNRVEELNQQIAQLKKQAPV